MTDHDLSFDEKRKRRAVLENAKLCAEQGWKGTFYLLDGEIIEKAFITGTNWEQAVISLEKVGERHLPARIVHLKDVEKVEVGWS